MIPQEEYPALMTYITERSSEDEKTAWKTLRADEAAAVRGDYAQVAQELENAQADYAVAQSAKGEGGSGYYGYHVLCRNHNNLDCVILSERRTQSDAQQNQADAGQKGRRRHPKPDKDDGT